MTPGSPARLRRAVLEAVAYADIFDSPLTVLETQRYLPRMGATPDSIRQVLNDRVRFGHEGGYFTLSGREGIIPLRLERKARSLDLLRRGIEYGRILGTLPFVRMTALTGSVAVLNVSGGADLDFMLVTEAGRLWVARAFAVSFGRLIRPFGYRICVNLLLSENAMHWRHHDIYSAHEICQMIPITGRDVYRRFRLANEWTNQHLPNARMAPPEVVRIPDAEPRARLQRILEFPFGGRTGDRLERWAMRIQRLKISNRPGGGDETEFGVNVCQANFHEHRRSTHAALRERIRRLDVEASEALEPVLQP